MKILLDIGHPAHVHYFRNLYHELKDRHQIFVTCKSVPIIIRLLEHYQIPYTTMGEKGDGLLNKAVRHASLIKKLVSLIKEQNIELAIGVSVLAVHAAKLSGIPSILFDDDDQSAQPLTSKFVTPFATTVLSPDALAHERLPRAIYYPGYHELAYLHPYRFNPDPTIPSKYGIKPTESYFVLRFNAFKAHHDVREGGMTKAQKRQLVDTLAEFGKVFITTENEIDKDFEPYRLPIAPHEIHHFLSFARMLVSDSQTMSTEASLLGIPAFRCNSFAGRLAVLEEEEKKYDLTYAYLPHQFHWMIRKIEGLLHGDEYRSAWVAKRNKLIEDKIDVTAFWVWLIDNYPASLQLLRTPRFDHDRFRVAPEPKQ